MQSLNRLLVAFSLLSVGGPALGIYDPSATTTKAPNRQETLLLPWYLTGNDTEPPDDGSRSPKWSIGQDKARKPVIIDAEATGWSQWQNAPGSDLEQRTELNGDSQQNEGIDDQDRGRNHPSSFNQDSQRPGRYAQDLDDSSGRFGPRRNRPGRYDQDSDGSSGSSDRRHNRPGRYDQDSDSSSGSSDRHRDWPGRYDQDSDDSSGSSNRRRDRPGRYDQDSDDSSGGSNRRRDRPGRYDQDSDDSSGGSNRRRDRPGRYDQDSDDSSGGSNRRRDRPGRYDQDSDDSSGSSNRRRDRPGRYDQDSDDSSGSSNRRRDRQGRYDQDSDSLSESSDSHSSGRYGQDSGDRSGGFDRRRDPPGRYDQDSSSSSGSSNRHYPGRYDQDSDSSSESSDRRSSGSLDRNRPGRHDDGDISGSYDQSRYDRGRYDQDRDHPGRGNRHRPGSFDQDRDHQNSGHQTESNPYEDVSSDSTKPHKETIVLSTKPKVRVARYDSLLGVQCPEVDSTGLFIYPPDCKFFVDCGNGRAFVRPCAPGTLFNPETMECDYPHKVKCYGGEVAEFPSSHPLDHSEKREPLLSTLRYDEESLRNPKCPPDVMGLLPHPADCTKFLQCASGITYIMDCGPGTVFNPAISVCDWPYNVKGCEDARKNTESNSPKTPPNPSGHTGSPSWTSPYVQPQPKKPECPKNFSGLLPHPDTCKKFLQCTKGFAFVMDCSPGTVFDNSTLLCDWPHKVPHCVNGKPKQTTWPPTTTWSPNGPGSWQTPPSHPGRGPWNTVPPVTTPSTPIWTPIYPPNTHTGYPGHTNENDRRHPHGLPPGHPRWQPPGHRPGHPNGYDPRTEGHWSRGHEHHHDHPGHHDPGHRHDHQAHGPEYPGHGYPQHGHRHYSEHSREDYPEHGHEQYPGHSREHHREEYDHPYPHQYAGRDDAVLEEGPANRRDDFPTSSQPNQNPWVPARQQPHGQPPSTSWNYPTYPDSDGSQSTAQVTHTSYDETQSPQYGSFGQVSPPGQQTGSVPTRETQGRAVPGFSPPGTNHPTYNRTSPPMWNTFDNSTAPAFWSSQNKTTWSPPEVYGSPPGQFVPSSWSPTQSPIVNQTQYPSWQQGKIGRDEKRPDWQTQTNVYQESTPDKGTDFKMDQWASKTNVLQQSKGQVPPGSKNSLPQDPSKTPYPHGIYVNVNGTWGHYVTKNVEIHQGHSKTRTYGHNEIPSSEKNGSRDTNYDFLLPPFEDRVNPSSGAEGSQPQLTLTLQPPFPSEKEPDSFGTQNHPYPLTLTLQPPFPSEREPSFTDYDFLQPPFEDPVNPSSSGEGDQPHLTLTLQPPFPSEKESDPTRNNDQSFLFNHQPSPDSSNSGNGGSSPLVLYLQPPLPDDKSFDPERTDPVSGSSYPPHAQTSGSRYRNPTESDNIAVGSSHPYASYQPPPRANYPSPPTSANQNGFYPSPGQPANQSHRQGRVSKLNSTEPRSTLPFVIYVVPSNERSDNRSKNSSTSTDTNNHYFLIPYPQPSLSSSNKSSSRSNSSVPYVFVLYPRPSTNRSVDLSLVLPHSLDLPTSVPTSSPPKTSTERPSTKPSKQKKKIPATNSDSVESITSHSNVPEVTIEYDGRDEKGNSDASKPALPEDNQPDVKKYDVDVLDAKEGWKPKLVFENKTQVSTTTESSVIMQIGKKTSDVELFNVNEPLQEEEPPFPIYYVPKVQPLSESQKVGPPTPISGQVVRLRGGTGPRDGYVEVQGARPGWGVVCDSRNSWTLKEAHVVCRQLGYERGAEMAWQGRNNRSGVPSWIAASSVTCSGNETRFQSCNFSHEPNCRVERDAIGVRCLPNRVAHCRKDEIPHEGQCYHLANAESGLNHAEALAYCSRRMARLIDVTSQAENDFVSEWLLQTHPEVTSIMTSGVGFTTLNRTIWLWEDSSRAKFKFSKWWPGWLEDKQRPPWIGKRPSCIVMKRKYPCHNRPESVCVADYFFWDAEDCATSSKGHSYICKRPYDDIGCVYGKGNQYSGNANVTASGKECLSWADSRVAHPLLVNVINREVREKLKTHNYCRNPNPHKESRPWCFTGAFGEREHCDIPACGRTGSQKSLQPGQCESRHFECMPGQCIPATWVCDGEEDCTNGADERTCSAHLRLFKKSAKQRLEGHDVEKWLNTPLKTCALRCKEADFTCRSFAHKAEGNVCLLSDSNVGMTGALKPTKEFDYYEMIERSMNCDGMFVCNNRKCINQTRVCNGKNDCHDRSDESICTPENLDYAVRLAGSNSSHEGRIEVKVLGHWGQVCDDGFGMINADVICKELGFSLGALEVRPGGFYGNLDPPHRFMVDQLRCRGDEKSLRECDFEGWGVHNCQPEEAVGVVCKTAVDSCQEGHWKCDNSPACIPTQFICDEVVDCPDGSDESAEHCDAPFEVRLANGSSKMEGRVEVRHHGVWGTVCDDDFTNTAARVICRSLGYGGLALAKKNSHFGPGEGPIWLDEVFCHGNESQLYRCEHNHWGQHNCDHNEDAGVICAPGDVNGPELPWETVPDSRLDNILPAECGKRSEDFNDDEDLIFAKVVRGSVARKGTYPWQASIRVRGHSRSSHWCGAVVLSPLHVLTAAHCLEGYNKGTYFVRAGDYNTEIDEGTEADANIEDYYIHEDFRKGHRMNNDIALVLLKGRGIPLGIHIMPICLPPENAEYPAGLNCTISGFGSIETGKSTQSRDLRYGWIPLLDQSICRAGYVYGDGAISDGMVCAGHLDEGVDTCDGDSGGPLACYRNGAFTLYGITSWGQHCGKANKPGVYTKVAYYRKWINQKIRESITGM